MNDMTPTDMPAETKTDLFSRFDPLIKTAAGRCSTTGVTDPFSLVMEKVLSPTTAICSGRETILLGTYNYMGMTFDPDVIAAGKQALDDFGSRHHRAAACSTALMLATARSRMRSRNSMAWIMPWYFRPAHQANLGIISTIAGKGDYIVLDIDSHASIWDGCKMGDAEVVPFKHNDIEAMEKRLKRIPEGAGKLVMLEGVYSMLGDIAPLKEMIRVAKENGAMVLGR